MTVFSIIETLLIEPLKLVFEIIFETAYRITDHPGIAIIFLSLIMNILVLPLYRRADTMQEEARDKETALSSGVTHIKKTFSGDEKMMILRTYYRQNNYSPVSALNGSLSLLLEIPFFLAAYQFLSHLELLNGVTLGPIADLGTPDKMLVIGGITLNLLPILMTVINIISGALYSKGFPLKTKVQIYGIAVIFLIFLYSSPAGLVFYWTLNNVFSLIKNIFYKLKNPAKTIRLISATAGLALLIFGIFIYDTVFINRKVFIIAAGLLLLLPLFLPMLIKALHLQKKTVETKSDGKFFLLGTVFLTLLTGLLIPSAFIASSPQEFVDIYCFHNPLWYVVKCFCMASGTFLIWAGVFYWLTVGKGRVIFEKFIWILCCIATVNYMFFGTDLGNISSSLQYDNGMYFSSHQKLINLLILLIIAGIMYLFVYKWKHIATYILIISAAAIGIMSTWNLFTIKTSVDKISTQYLAQNDEPHFQLSTTGHNVVVIMLDRAMGAYIPYLFQENPQLKEQFAGFTYYENTISFGGSTNFGTPPLFGGYEYTPIEINKRSEEPLVSKHNEALRVMPAIFSENGYAVTVCDPIYANYQWIPDLSIYDDYPDVAAYITNGHFEDTEQKQAVIEQNNRNFFCYSIMKTLPLFLQPIIYSDGRYYQAASDSVVTLRSYSVQTRNSISLAVGLDATFMEAYYVLENLPDMTNITEAPNGTFLLMANNMTHEPMLLQEPDYTPVWNVDNTLYDAENIDRFVLDGREMIVDSDMQMAHYQINMAAMIQLGNWFDYLRENNIYDNTRIILVSDHGFPLAQFEELILGDTDDITKDMERYYPLLLVKDFGSSEFVVSDDFMTTADVPVLAMENIIIDPVNPFTGNSINSNEKYSHEQFVILSEITDMASHTGNTFQPSAWASVHDNIWDRNNWTFYDVQTVLDEHAAP